MRCDGRSFRGGDEAADVVDVPPTARLRRVTLAALVATVLLTILVVFQLALALGAPLGDMAWGGQHPGVLPTPFRVASAVVGLVVYPAIMLAILSTGGVLQLDLLPPVESMPMWVLAALFLFSAAANAASRSKRERIWAPVSLVIATCCVVIALGS
jgi:hypothetical protein